MPIYEYACDTCQITFERKQSFSDDPVRTCPDCGSDVRRVLYPAGIIFKGSGFYVTDNRSSNSASSSDSAKSTNGTSSTESSDSSSKTSASESKASSSSSSEAADS